jgi:hypothetical protein
VPDSVVQAAATCQGHLYHNQLTLLSMQQCVFLIERVTITLLEPQAASLVSNGICMRRMQQLRARTSICSGYDATPASRTGFLLNTRDYILTRVDCALPGQKSAGRTARQSRAFIRTRDTVRQWLPSAGLQTPTTKQIGIFVCVSSGCLADCVRMGWNSKRLNTLNAVTLDPERISRWY